MPIWIGLPASGFDRQRAAAKRRASGWPCRGKLKAASLLFETVARDYFDTGGLEAVAKRFKIGDAKGRMAPRRLVHHRRVLLGGQMELLEAALVPCPHARPSSAGERRRYANYPVNLERQPESSRNLIHCGARWRKPESRGSRNPRDAPPHLSVSFQSRNPTCPRGFRGVGQLSRDTRRFPTRQD